MGEEERVTTMELFRVHLNMTPDRIHWHDHQRLKRAMHRLGWEGPSLMWLGTKRLRGYLQKFTETPSGPSVGRGQTD